MSHQVTSKGQVTIPKKVRDFLGIKPGTAIAFEPTADGRVVIVNAGQKSRITKPSRFAALRGTATVKMTTRQIMALTRGGG
jgi:AbrB family looped-hinge helix DNA binding protein